QQIGAPIVAGGLITTAAQVRAALEAGAVAISTSKQSLWEL
ncbi:MAG: glycerol-3-phosphate responsive antiterminator, partial [Christensenellaceae bacterium]|nr:glycerol-3-phosphate responsive antiterminator [Christensenellaceae bacterium]